jgi:hypothetical protein
MSNGFYKWNIKTEETLVLLFQSIFTQNVNVEQSQSDSSGTGDKTCPLRE